MNPILNNFIKDFESFYAVTKEIAYIVDLENKIVAVSEQFELEFALPANKVINNSLNELKTTSLILYQKNPHIFNAQNKSVIALKTKHIYMDVRLQESDPAIFIVYKYPILNLDNECIGIHIQMRPFTILRLVYLLQNALKIRVIPKEEPSAPILSDQQHMILFLYARNHSNLEVAEFLNAIGYRDISTMKVNDHLKNLKILLNAQSNEQLKDKAVQYGYDLTIPAGLLVEGSYQINNTTAHLWTI